MIFAGTEGQLHPRECIQKNPLHAKKKMTTSGLIIILPIIC